ncbi:double-strand break repair protein AddB [Croceicoccus sp. YJ47]|uniref:double-strand break repair protein AddB n=1 Tax=Croceicoccus sp. YJ47 TaxID=2798724 RepID=UPI00192066E4|nr:double-strand break repair protein AddB [Croceicoccus sp. YJ47]QQN73839.1 double-strand break repair protein AddB [Croceicoccus sp. YJ47]
MSETATRLSLYSIAAHRGFADALVAGLIPRYGEKDAGLARLTLLLPSRRAIRTVTEAFVRLSGGGLLLPRMAVIGDLDLDETLGALLDPIGSDNEIPPAADPTRRWLRLAQMLRLAMERAGMDTISGQAALLRQARDIARGMDRLLVEGIGPEELMSARVLDLVGELSEHWVRNLHLFASVQAMWLAELQERGELDAPARRTRLFDHAAAKWSRTPPAGPIVAAGVTSASPSIARLLRVIAEMPEGSVVLPDLDLALDDAVWDGLGRAGKGEDPDDPPIGAGDAVTHPQYHLKLLLNRMGVARGEVRPWHRAGMSKAPPERSRAISNLFLPPEQSATWIDLPPEARRLSGVRLMETAHPEEEAQAIAILIREALETPERRVALITPDRGLAGRVIAHLERWNIAADDTAGRPLPQTVAGRMLLLLSEVLAERGAAIPLLSVLMHPYAGLGSDGGGGDERGTRRAAWLSHARRLDLAMRGPRLDIGLAPLREAVHRVAERRGDPAMRTWWDAVEHMLAPLVTLGGEERIDLAASLDALAAAAEGICGLSIWGEADGRALAAFVEDLREQARGVPTMLEPAELPAMLRDAMEQVAVRPPYGGHERLAIYGLIEARMSRADLVICGALHEGSWPQPATTDPLIAPAVLRALGVPGGDFRIGLSAHDLAAALGAPEVVLSHARRDSSGPVIASRFILRVRAMLGPKLLETHVQSSAPALCAAIDRVEPVAPHSQPRPMPSAEQRRVGLSATGLDRLRSDPYQFYARSILRLHALDAIDDEPTPAWRGSAVHDILHRWHRDHGAAPGTLHDLARDMLHAMSGHPFMRGLWQPRLLAALDWIEAETAALVTDGRTIAATECKGVITVDGVRVEARADRIDRLADGTLAIVDYKTGRPPSASMVEEGFALQLGTTGLVAARGGFHDAGIDGTPDRFEYWSLARGKDGFGFRDEPVKEGRKRTGLAREEFLDQSAFFLSDAIAKWIAGDAPFTARLNPDLPGYNEYDQLMRLDEWQGRARRDPGEGDSA